MRYVDGSAQASHYPWGTTYREPGKSSTDVREKNRSICVSRSQNAFHIESPKSSPEKLDSKKVLGT